MIRVLVTQVRPEKYRDYLVFQKNVILPAIKKSGTKDYNFADVHFGDPGPTFVSVVGISNWADLDDGVGAQKGVTADEYKAIVDQAHSLIVSSNFLIYRYQPDLSYCPRRTRREISLAASANVRAHC